MFSGQNEEGFPKIGESFSFFTSSILSGMGSLGTKQASGRNESSSSSFASRIFSTMGSVRTEHSNHDDSDGDSSSSDFVFDSEDDVDDNENDEGLESVPSDSISSDTEPADQLRRRGHPLGESGTSSGASSPNSDSISNFSEDLYAEKRFVASGVIGATRYESPSTDDQSPRDHYSRTNQETSVHGAFSTDEQYIEDMARRDLSSTTSEASMDQDPLTEEQVSMYRTMLYSDRSEMVVEKGCDLPQFDPVIDNGEVDHCEEKPNHVIGRTVDGVVAVGDNFVTLYSILSIRKRVFSFLPGGPARQHPMLYINMLRLTKDLYEKTSIKLQDTVPLSERCLSLVNWSCVSHIDMRRVVIERSAHDKPHLSDRPGGTVVVIANEMDLIQMRNSLAKLTRGKARFIFTDTQFETLYKDEKIKSTDTSVEIDIGRFFGCFNRSNVVGETTGIDQIKQSFNWVRLSFKGKDEMSVFIEFFVKAISQTRGRPGLFTLLIDHSEDPIDYRKASDSIEVALDKITDTLLAIPKPQSIIYDIGVRLIDRYGSEQSSSIDAMAMWQEIPLTESNDLIESRSSGAQYDPYADLSNRHTKATEHHSLASTSTGSESRKSESRGHQKGSSSVSIPSMVEFKKETTRAYSHEHGLCCDVNAMSGILAELYRYYKKR